MNPKKHMGDDVGKWPQQRRPRILTAAPGHERAASKLLCLHGAESSNSPLGQRGAAAWIGPADHHELLAVQAFDFEHRPRLPGA